MRKTYPNAKDKSKNEIFVPSDPDFKDSVKEMPLQIYGGEILMKCQKHYK